MDARITDLFDLNNTISKDYLSRFVWPWEALSGLKDFILELGRSLPATEFYQVKEGVWVAKDANVFDSAYLGEAIIVDHGAQVRQCAFVRGPAIIGKGAVAGNSSELKNAILFDAAEVPHFNYVGDSILGFHAHMGAGSITSNLKSDGKNVVVRGKGESIETGLRKLGAILGDNAEIGCNSVLNPGSVIGRNSRVYPLSSIRGFIPADSIFKSPGNIVDIQ